MSRVAEDHPPVATSSANHTLRGAGSFARSESGVRSSGLQGRKPPGPSIPRAIGLVRAIERDPLGSMEALRREYGDVVSLNLAVVRLFLVFHPDGVRQVLQERHTNYNKDTFDWRILKPVVGEGLLTSDGSHWLRQRRLMQPAFHRERIAALGSLMTERTLEMLQRWSLPAAAGHSLDVASEMGRLTLDIVTRALFGAEIGGDAQAVGEAFTTLNRTATAAFFSPLAAVPRLAMLLNPPARKAKSELDRIVQGVIDLRRREGSETSSDLLGMLLAARDEETGYGMSDKQLRDEVLTLMIAGHETTANALAWTWYLLSKHTDVAKRLDRELAEVLGGATPSVEDLPRLSYTRMVIEESMRLYPPAWATSRHAIAADEIGGVGIPAKSVVVLSPFITHRHPDVWEQPDDFDPERFSPERAAARVRFAYYPFGGGPRLCIGSAFALTEMSLVVATVAQRYRLELTEPEREIRPEALITLRPKGGVTMKPIQALP